jgi:hypothetical protein
MTILNIFSKIHRRLWQLGQPLIIKPKYPQSQISDLFVWRDALNWKTYFELINVPSIFDNNIEDSTVQVVFFKENGKEFFRENIDLIANYRQKIDISNLLKKIKKTQSVGDIGTFAVFHSYTPKIVLSFNAYLSECGYVSYKYNNAPLNSYVHGNFEAIACYNNFEMLSASSIFKRKYNLQYSLNSVKLYEIALVNITNKIKKVSFLVLDINHNKLIKETFYIESKGSFVYKIQNSKASRLIIISRLIMARPVVFEINKNNLNVFHG